MLSKRDFLRVKDFFYRRNRKLSNGFPSSVSTKSFSFSLSHNLNDVLFACDSNKYSSRPSELANKVSLIKLDVDFANKLWKGPWKKKIFSHKLTLFVKGYAYYFNNANTPASLWCWQRQKWKTIFFTMA